MGHLPTPVISTVMIPTDKHWVEAPPAMQENELLTMWFSTAWSWKKCLLFNHSTEMGIHRYSIIIMWHSTVGIHRYTIIIIIGIQPSHGYLRYLTKKRYDGHGLIVHLRHCGEILGGPSMWKVANQHQNRRDGGIPWLLGVAGLKMFHFPFLLWYQWYQWYRTSQSLGHLTSTCWLKLGDLFMNRSRFKTMLVDDYRGLQLYILVIPPKRSTSKCHCLICCCDFTFLSFGASTIESNLDNLGTITQSMNWESLSSQELTKMVWRIALVWPSDLSCTWQARTSTAWLVTSWSSHHPSSSPVSQTTTFLSSATLMAWRHCERAWMRTFWTAVYSNPKG